jgi:hypothetical protein
LSLTECPEARTECPEMRTEDSGAEGLWRNDDSRD